MKLDVFVDEITAFMGGRDGGWSGSAGEFLRAMRWEVRRV